MSVGAAIGRGVRDRRAWSALVGGLLVALSMPPWGFWPLAFVGIAVFETSLGEDPTAGRRFRRGWLFGAGWLLPALGWMWFLTAPGYLAAVAMFAVLHGLAELAAPSGNWRVVGRPAAHLVAEALRLVVPFGGVPLATLAIGQAGGPLLGVARVGGVPLLSWLVLQVGFALSGPSPYVPATVRRRRGAPGSRGPAAAWHGAIGLGVAVVVVVLAAVAPSGSDTGRSLRVSVVQGGGPQGTHALGSDPRVVVDRHLAATRTIAPGSADLVLWPENVVDVTEFATSPELGEIAAEAARIGAPIAVGITEEAPRSAGDTVGHFLNAQVVVTPDGRITSRYEKVHRVPYGEYVPLRRLLESLGAPVDQVPRDAVPGHGPAVIHLPDGTALGVVISWEVFFADRARDAVDHGGQVVLNPTNGSSYTGTILQTQQVASSRLRAVETGRWVVQAAPTGFSAFVTVDGDVRSRTKVSEQRVITDVVPLRTGTTWYTSMGDLPVVAMALVVLLLSHAVPGRWWRRSRRSVPSTP